MRTYDMTRCQLYIIFLIIIIIITIFIIIIVTMNIIDMEPDLS